MLAWGTLQRLRDELKLVFRRIKEELDDHLESINENTIEIQTQYEYLAQLANRVEKLAERVARLERVLTQPVEEEHVTFIFAPDEEEVFLFLLDAAKIQRLVTYDALAEKLGVRRTYAASLIARLVEKGIPIEKKLLGEQILIELDRQFAQRQIDYRVVMVE